MARPRRHGMSQLDSADEARSRTLLGAVRAGQQLLITDQQAGMQVATAVEVGLDSEGDPMVVVLGPGGRRTVVDTPSVVSGRIQLSDDLKLGASYLEDASYPVAKTGWNLDT